MHSAGTQFLTFLSCTPRRRRLASGIYRVEWGEDTDLTRARELCARHRALRLGLVDGTVVAVAERLRAPAIATLDLRHFAALRIHGQPRLLPRDLP